MNKDSALKRPYMHRNGECQTQTLHLPLTRGFSLQELWLTVHQSDVLIRKERHLRQVLGSASLSNLAQVSEYFLVSLGLEVNI
jgi:hypothetical protein